MVKSRYLTLQWIIAGALVFFLPFSSFPLVAKLMGSSMVAPLSVLPLLLLLVGWLVPYFLRWGKLPPQSSPLFGFAVVSLLSGAAAFFLLFPPYKSATILRSEVEALVSLSVGICFYLVTALWANEYRRLLFLLRWINWGGLLVIVWAFIQAATWSRFRSYPDWMWNFQGMVSSSLLLYTTRVNGFAYEPSWLAHQLNMIYLPFWLAATVNGFTAHRMKLWKISLENFLLLGGGVVLLLSVSRIGLLAFLVMFAYLVLQWNLRLLKWLPKLVMQRLQAAGKRMVSSRKIKVFQRWITVASIAVLLLFYAALLVGAAYGLSRYDARMQKLFDFSTLKEKSFFHYANQLVFAERIVFWQAGWEVFNDYPILGVGPGNAGFFFPQKLSAFSWALTEIRTLMYHWTALPNIKSLWVRLLAETGVFGFAFFASWCYVLWQAAQFLQTGWLRRFPPAGDRARSPLKLFQVIGLAGALALSAFLVEGFSLDTFALPYYWITFGLLTAACELARRPVQTG